MGQFLHFKFYLLNAFLDILKMSIRDKIKMDEFEKKFEEVFSVKHEQLCPYK